MSKKKTSERKGMTHKQAYEYMVHHAETLDLFEIVDQGLENEYGFIKFLNEGLSPEQKATLIQKGAAKEADYPYHCYSELLEKIESGGNSKTLKFVGEEREILKRALNLAVKYATGMRDDYERLQVKLAWANTAFLNKENSYEKNLREAGRRLGFTKNKELHWITEKPGKTGGKGKKYKFDPFKVRSHYQKTLKETDDRHNAVLKTQKKFDFASPDACARYLRECGLKNIPGFRPKK